MERNTSKKYKTEGRLELRTRIYDAKLIKAISDLWADRAVFYKNCKNDFISDLIAIGVESLMFEDKNVSQAMRVDTILNRLDKIEENSISNGGEIIELLKVLYMRHLENYEWLSKIDKKIKTKKDCLSDNPLNFNEKIPLMTQSVLMGLDGGKTVIQS